MIKRTRKHRRGRPYDREGRSAKQARSIVGGGVRVARMARHRKREMGMFMRLASCFATLTEYIYDPIDDDIMRPKKW